MVRIYWIDFGSLLPYSEPVLWVHHIARYLVLLHMVIVAGLFNSELLSAPQAALLLMKIARTLPSPMIGASQ